MQIAIKQQNNVVTLYRTIDGNFTRLVTATVTSKQLQHLSNRLGTNL